jgi:hypothetical protein
MSGGSSCDAGDSDTQNSLGSEEGTSDEGEGIEEEDVWEGPARRRQSTAATGRRSRIARRRTARRNTAQNPAPAAQLAAAAHAGQAPPAAAQHMQQALYQPYSNTTVVEYPFDHRIRIPSALCTDLAELHSEGSCPVHESVVLHPSGWADSEGCRAYILQQQHPHAEQQQQQHGGHTTTCGSIKGTLKLFATREVHVRGVSYGSQLKLYAGRSLVKSHMFWCCKSG